MLTYSKGHKISLNLTLVNNDGSPEENADVNYKIYNESYTMELSGNNLPFNSQLGSYIDVINPEVDGPSQEEGIYFVKWEISNTEEEFPNSATEELIIESITETLSANFDEVTESLDDLHTKTESLSASNQSNFDDLESLTYSLSATNQDNFDDLISLTNALSASNENNFDSLETLTDELSAFNNTNFDEIDNTLDNLISITESLSGFNDVNFTEIDDNINILLSKTESLSATNQDNFDELDDKLLRVLGLIHENTFIDQPKYDRYDNLVSARMRIYSDSASVGTDNNIIGEYEIRANGTAVGKFSYGQQKRIDE